VCPMCVGSALLFLTGAGSAGGLALAVLRGPRPRAREKDREGPRGATETGLPAAKTAERSGPLQLQ
jgi:hypothetical protein